MKATQTKLINNMLSKLSVVSVILDDMEKNELPRTPVHLKETKGYVEKITLSLVRLIRSMK